ncbi:hypothetical protein [Cupriavidus taiwanensis]|uniref:hypothetical protein n=1 Tax=Cupriavidus taiwanensis TaxID=164546 RepID=UPI0011C052C0|nr:hypothetical protein [Cupriavidus taiwanensis]
MKNKGVNMTRTQSQRYIDALAQLPHFIVTFREPHQDGELVHALTGAVITALPDPDETRHELLQVTFPGGQPFQVHGGLYLDLHAVEAERHWKDSAENGTGPISKQVSNLVEHLRRKHSL